MAEISKLIPLDKMKKSIIVLLASLLCVTCSVFTSKGQYKTESSSQVENRLNTFIENHKWELNGTERRPLIAATPVELSRLKAAWAGSGAEHEVLARRFARADEAIAKGLTIPPEGGQHNPEVNEKAYAIYRDQ